MPESWKLQTHQMVNNSASKMKTQWFEMHDIYSIPSHNIITNNHNRNSTSHYMDTSQAYLHVLKIKYIQTRSNKMAFLGRPRIHIFLHHSHFSHCQYYIQFHQRKVEFRILPQFTSSHTHKTPDPVPVCTANVSVGDKIEHKWLKYIQIYFVTKIA